MNKPKLQYDVVITTGRAARELKRNQEKKALKIAKGKLQSPLGKMRSRRERKAMAKSLKIKFTPRYNGPVYKYVPGKDEDGNIISILTEVK